MSENKIAFPVKLASNNPKSFGVVDATDISGHRSVDTLSDLYSISDPILSTLKDGSDAIGQEWFVISEDCKYRLDNWANRKTVAGWTKLPKQELINTKQSVSEKDQPSGYAGLDSNGKIPIEKTYGTTATVVNVATYASLPVTGLSGVIYYVSNTGAQYKWSGSTYIDITGGADNAKKNETSIFDCSNGTSTKYYSSLLNAINVVPPAYRTSNRIISYLSTENSTTSAVNYQFHGIDSTTWTDLTKWKRIPNQADLADIRSEQSNKTKNWSSDAGLIYPDTRVYDGVLWRVKNGATTLATDIPNKDSAKWEMLGTKIELDVEGGAASYKSFRDLAKNRADNVYSPNVFSIRGGIKNDGTLNTNSNYKRTQYIYVEAGQTITTNVNIRTTDGLIWGCVFDLSLNVLQVLSDSTEGFKTRILKVEQDGYIIINSYWSTVPLNGLIINNKKVYLKPDDASWFTGKGNYKEQILATDKRMAMYNLNNGIGNGVTYAYPLFFVADFSCDRLLYKITSATNTDIVGCVIVYDKSQTIIDIVDADIINGVCMLGSPILIKKGYGYTFSRKTQGGMYLRTMDYACIYLNNLSIGSKLEKNPNKSRLIFDVDYHLVRISETTTYVTPQNSCVILQTGSSLTHGGTSYFPEIPSDILNNFSDVLLYNIAVGGHSLTENLNTISNNWNTEDSNYYRSIPFKYIFYNNCANGTKFGVEGFRQLYEAYILTKSLGAEMLIGSEEDYGNVKQYELTSRNFAERYALKYSPIGGEQSKCYPKSLNYSPYKGFVYSGHYNYRGRAAYYSHLEMLNSLFIEKSVKMYRVRPQYKNGVPVISDLMYDTKEQRAQYFTALLTKNYSATSFKPNEQDNLDNRGNSVPESEVKMGTNTETISFLRGEPVGFRRFALIECILDKTNISFCKISFLSNINPSNIYLLRLPNFNRDNSFNSTVIRSTYDSLDFDYTNGVVSIDLSGTNLQQYDKLRLIIEGGDYFTVANPVFYDYDGTDKIYDNKKYEYRKYGVELSNNTSVENGWILSSGATIGSFPAEIANYTSYNNVKSHIELQQEGSTASKSVNITKVRKIAIRIVAQKFNKIATIRYNGSGGILDPTLDGGSKYVDNKTTVTPYSYEYGKIAVTINGLIYRELIIMQGWHESYFEVDLSGDETSIDIKVEKLSFIDNSYTNHLQPILIHDVSIQDISSTI